MRSQMQHCEEAREPEADQLLNSHDPVLFNWKNRWLRGHQYEHILRNVDQYSQKFGIEKYASKAHPSEIYDAPANGTMYFIEGRGLGSDFGFPRVQSKKKFRWKKMNFPTHLPKTAPRVTYIVASTTSCNQINEAQERVFRMHVVTLHDETARKSCGYLLCHILQIKKKNYPEKLSGCISDGRFDYYKLFAFLHNLTILRK